MDSSNIKNTINDANRRLKILNAEVSVHQEIIKNLQKVCEHDWVCIGYDLRKEHYTCSICGDMGEW